MTLFLDLHTCNLNNTRTRQATNPFTKKVVHFPIDDGLTEAEQAKVRALLKEVHASDPDPDGYCKVRCADGGNLNVTIGDLLIPNGRTCHVECEALTEEATRFIFNLARAGNLSIGSSINPFVALTSPPATELVAKRWPGAPVIQSADELGVWLRANFGPRRK
jgi:hypothetical protein